MRTGAANEVACKVHQFHGHIQRHGRARLAVGLGEITMPRAEEICHDLDLYSSVASCFSGVELSRRRSCCLAIGRRRRALSDRPCPDGGHAGYDGIYDLIRNAGLPLRTARADDLKGRLVDCSSNARPNGEANSTAAARSCSTIPTSRITATRRPRSAAPPRCDRRPRRVHFGRRHASGTAGQRPCIAIIDTGE